MTFMPFSLPPDSYRQPVVLVCGDALDDLFGTPGEGGPALRLTARGCYVAVPDVQQLTEQVARLLDARPDWRSQLSLLLVSNPQSHADSAALQARLSLLAYQFQRLRKQGLVLPLMQVSYLQSACLPDAEAPWFCWHDGEDAPVVYQCGDCTSLDHWQGAPADRLLGARRLRACLQLGSVAALLAGTLQPLPVAPIAWAVSLVPEVPQQVAGNLWQQWLQNRTGLGAATQPAAPLQPRLALPDALLPLLPQRSGSSVAQRRRWRALWLGTLVGMAGLALSAWHNGQLLHQVSHDLQHYLELPVAQHPDQPAFVRREQALTALQVQAERLERYYRNGEPWHLGLGLYHGDRLRVPVLEAIATYRPPVPAPALPRTVRLDSLSLFDPGSARLKPESAKVLINALVGIKARPGWLIVIAGHTDASGDARSNQQLSEARAAAVRDWMQRMGDIADDCFAVQGFGASQPVAGNDNETGRAANRRVDIRLVPASGACALPVQAPATPVALRDIQ